MARSFSSWLSQYLSGGPLPGSSNYNTFACWFYDTTGNGYGLMSYSSAGGGSIQLAARFDAGTVSFFSDNLENIVTTANYSLNAWNHAATTFGPIDNNTSVSCAVYLNGGSKGTGSARCSSATTKLIGARQSGGALGRYMDGYIAEAAAWEAALTDDEILALSKGCSPLLIRPESLLSYCPLIGRASPEIDLFGTGPTLVNAPTVADHPPKMIYPRRRGQIVMPASVAASDGPFFAGGGECVGLPIWEACGLI